MRLIPMSMSELAWDLFYENQTALDQYRPWASARARAEMKQTWCRADVCWEQGRVGQAIARLTRKLPRGGVDTRGCSHLRFFGAVSPLAVLRLTVNGRTHELRGNGQAAPYTVPIGGGRVRSLVFEWTARRDGAGACSLVWTALVDGARDAERLKPRGCWDEAWPGLLLPASAPIAPQVKLGLLFGANDLAALRRKARTALYAPWMDCLRAQGRKLLRRRPESLIGDFAAPPLHYTRPAERDGFAAHFDSLALAGLLDGDKRMLRHAARWMLSVASCRYWYNDFAGELPGVRWHHRSFVEAHLCGQMALALDWAGAALTEEGRAVVRDAIARRGLPRIQHDFLAHEYIRSMNQGIVFNSGRILAMLALCKAWPRAEVRLREVRDDTRDMFARTFDRNGGSVEGPAYWLYTLAAGLPGVIALARHDGRRPADLMPGKMRRVPAYPFIFESTAQPGHALPIADSHGGPLCTGALAAMLTHVFPGEDSDCLAAWALRNPDATDADPALALIFGPARLPAARPLLPEFAVRPATAHALVCRKMSGVGPVRLQCYGARGCGGSHSHHDRGNILLEAGGEWVFVDRGVGHYSNPAQQVKRPEAHNLLVPDMPDGGVPRQNLGHERDIAPRASYRRGVFRAAIDATAAWPDHVTECRRTVTSPTPGVFEISDELEMDRALGAVLHFHTPCRLKRRRNGLLLVGRNVQVRIEPLWQPQSTLFARDNMGVGRPDAAYGHLWLRSAPARRHRLVTRVVVEPRR